MLAFSAPAGPARSQRASSRVRPSWLRASLCSLCGLTAALALPAQSSSSTPSSHTETGHPVGDIRQLLLDVEANERRSEAAQRDYTYHVHTVEQDLDKSGAVRKTNVIDSESLTLDGVRVDRVVARGGVPLTPDAQQKEDERIDKVVAQRKQKRAKLENEGASTDAEGNQLLPASRILELGTFSNPRQTLLDGRSTLILDYAGDPQAKTRNTFEGVVRDLTGTVWIDETDRILIRGQGQFRDDFKLGGGLLVNIHKGTHFDFRAARQPDGTWLPATVDGTGSARVFLVEGFNGRIHVATSDYRRFQAKATILASSQVVDAEGQPLPASSGSSGSAGGPGPTPSAPAHTTGTHPQP